MGTPNLGYCTCKSGHIFDVREEFANEWQDHRLLILTVAEVRFRALHRPQSGQVREWKHPGRLRTRYEAGGAASTTGLGHRVLEMARAG
jgi:hypothetical protein